MSARELRTASESKEEVFGCTCSHRPRENRPLHASSPLVTLNHNTRSQFHSRTFVSHLSTRPLIWTSIFRLLRRREGHTPPPWARPSVCAGYHAMALCNAQLRILCAYFHGGLITVRQLLPQTLACQKFSRMSCHACMHTEMEHTPLLRHGHAAATHTTHRSSPLLTPSHTTRLRPLHSMRAAAVLLMAAMAAGQSGEEPAPEAKSSGGSTCSPKSGCSSHPNVTATSGCDLCCFGRPVSLTLRYNAAPTGTNYQAVGKWGTTGS